jgi:hypothetical protein
MFRQAFILCACLFVLGGCIYNDEPTPEIVHDYTHSSRVIKPSIRNPSQNRTIIYGNVPDEWFPPAYLEARNRWQGIIIHHSAVSYGSADHEHKYHKLVGWDGLGYHFVINNGVLKNGFGRPDGLVEVGYRWRGQKDGAHCRTNGDKGNYWNKHTVGICLVGNFEQTYPTRRQRQSLIKLVRFLQQRYNVPTNQIRGHRDIEPTACPGKNFSMSRLKAAFSR